MRAIKNRREGKSVKGHETISLVLLLHKDSQKQDTQRSQHKFELSKNVKWEENAFFNQIRHARTHTLSNIER